MKSAIRASLFALVSSLGVACANDRTQARFDLRYAPDFAPKGAPYSVFGVFKDGRMSADGWHSIASGLGAWLGSAECDPLYSNALAKRNHELSEAIDAYASADGISDPLLELFAGAAEGEAIATFTMVGEPSGDAGVRSPPPSFGGSMGGGRRGRGRRGGGGAPRPIERARSSGMELELELFSVRARRTEAVLSMTYGGASMNEALEKFRAELAKELPGASCAGWNHEAEPEPGAVRERVDRE